MNFSDLLTDPPALPVCSAIPDIAETEGNVVIAAPPGSGKTTIVPAIFADLLPGSKVIVVQPRRVAARAAAKRIASLLGEPVGDRIGFRVRGQSMAGRSIEMVTPGVMLRMIQSDPELSGVGCVIVDEIHERDLETDLVTAFVLDIQESLRPDLRLVAMSATVALEQTAALLGGCVVNVPGEIHPVDIHDVPGPQPLSHTRSGAIVVANDFIEHVAQVVFRARRECSGSILVFVPGVREISAVSSRLSGMDIPVMALHGQLGSREQDRVLEYRGDRVIVATALAESSLTVPGVRVVVDSGLARESRVDSGVGGLVTVFASQASMIQRAGRAGREAPGVAYRCIPLIRAEKYALPEIRTADLTDAVLQCSAWGAPRMSGLRLLDPPHPGHLDFACSELRSLGLMNDDGAVTPLGRHASTFPLGAREARALIDGCDYVGVSRGTDICAFLSAGMRIDNADLPAAIRRGRNSDIEREARRLRKLIADAGVNVSRETGTWTLDDAVGIVVGLAHPQWIARARGQGYVLANGRGAVLPENSPLVGEEWLAIADLGHTQGRSDAMIYAAAPIDAEIAVMVAEHLITETVEIVDGGEIRGVNIRRLGEIELSRTDVTLSPTQLVEARKAAVRRRGITGLPWNDATSQVRQRMAFLHAACGEPWPDVSDAALDATLDDWLLPFVTAHGIDLPAALNALKPWETGHLFDELAPERIATPLGTSRLDYSSGKPRANMRIQEAFGWEKTPEICGIRVTLELLSPARRPLAITDDLESFWAGPYHGVRADMRGRYPKHPWPEDPAHAQATRRTKKRDAER